VNRALTENQKKQRAIEREMYGLTRHAMINYLNKHERGQSFAGLPTVDVFAAYQRVKQRMKARADEARRCRMLQRERRAKRLSVGESWNDWYAQASEAQRMQMDEWQRERLRTQSLRKYHKYMRDPEFAEKQRLRQRRMRRRRGQQWINCRNSVNKAIRRRKASATLRWLGYTVEDVLRHIESLFVDGMSWDRIDEIHIDHIIPHDQFELSCDQQVTSLLGAKQSATTMVYR
jgi:hypothetical protein